MKNSLIKKVGRKYLFPLILGVGLALGSSAYADDVNLPVSEETKKILVEREEREKLGSWEYNIKEASLSWGCYDKLEEIKRYFNNSIKDEKFTIEEQRELLFKFREIEDYKKEFKKLGINYNLPAPEQKLRSLLRENLKGVDILKPSLEKKLESQGIKVHVERKRTYKDIGSILGLILAGLFISYRIKRLSRPCPKPYPPSDRFYSGLE